jgi:hypothetical protein
VRITPISFLLARDREFDRLIAGALPDQLSPVAEALREAERFAGAAVLDLPAEQEAEGEEEEEREQDHARTLAEA